MNLNKNIKLLAWFNFFTDFRPWVPIWILYFQKITGSFTTSLSVFSIIFISSALFEIPTGIFSDKFGRKNTIVIGAFFSLMSIIFYAIGISPIILFIGAIFQGFSRSLYSGNNDALLHATLQESKQENQYHVFLGKTSSMFQLASMFAAVAGGFIAGISFSLVLWISVIPQIICLILALFMKEPNVKTKTSGNIYEHLKTAFEKFKENKQLRLLSLGTMIEFGMGNSAFEFQQAFYGIVWPVWALGIARALSNAAGYVSYYFSGKIINKFSATKMLLVSGITTPIIKTVVAVFVTPFSPAIMAFMSIFYGVGNVSGNSLQQKEFTNEQRATMASLISLGGSLFTALSAFFLGVAADHFGIIIALIFAQIVLILNSYFYFRVYKIKLSTL